MRKVLYINGNPQTEAQSYSRRVGRYYLESIQAKESDVIIEEINLYEEQIPMIDQEILDAWNRLRNQESFADLTTSQQAKVKAMQGILTQFKEADEYVFVTPLWNFSVPPMMKAYVDNVMIAGETFKYTEAGPVGLLQDKKAVIIQASGGVYIGNPSAKEHGFSFLETVLNFMGVEDVAYVPVEGIAIPGKSDAERLEEVYQTVDQLQSYDAA